MHLYFVMNILYQFALEGKAGQPTTQEDDDEKSPSRFPSVPVQNIVQNGDTVLLAFADGRYIFAEAKSKVYHHQHKEKKDSGSSGNNVKKINVGRSSGTVKIQRRSYSTHALVGIPYGTVLQVERNHLEVLPPTASLLPPLTTAVPDSDEVAMEENDQFCDGLDEEKEEENDKDVPRNQENTPMTELDEDKDGPTAMQEEEIDHDKNIGTNTKPDMEESATTVPQPRGDGKDRKGPPESAVINNSNNFTMDQKRDNRHLVDNNTSQGLNQDALMALRRAPRTTGHEIVQKLISHSSTFANKTEFSQAKYIRKKQLKYQLRCRVVKPSINAMPDAVPICFPKPWRRY